MSSSNSFPSGLKVLVVDDDAPTLKVVSAMLQKCAYQVTPATSGKEALSILRDKRQHHFDLVLSDVMMPDMDGFRLLELIGLELDLPVIMMSSNGETNTVLRGVTHGAVDFLIKPVRLEELRNMWQHVVRRRRDLVKEESEDHSGEKEEVMPEQTGKKRKEHAAQAAQDLQDDDANASKKARVVWSVEMHQQFVNAVNQLGVDKAVPKKILEIMQVDGLTRENVASHLQKYRLYLKRVATHGGQPGPVGLAGPSGHGGSTAAMNGTAGAQAGPSGLQSQPSGSVSARGAKNAANGHAGAAAQGNAAATQGGMPGISGAAPGLDPTVAAAAADPSPSPDPAAAAAGMAGIGPLGGPNPMGTPGFPNPLLGPMPNPMAAMMNSAAAMNPMLGGMNPLSLGMGLPPGMGQGPMQIPGLPMAGLPMSMPFMPGMGMPGMMPGMMPPPVPGLTLQGASSQPSALGSASTTSTPRQGSGSLGQQQQLLAQQQQQQQQLLAQQQQNSGGSSSGGSAGTHMGMPGQLGLQGYPLGVSPSGSPAPAQGAAMGLGLGAVRPPGVTLSGLQPGPSQLHQGATAMGAGGPTGGMVAAAPGVPNGSGLDDLFDHAELAAAFDGLYHGVDEAAGAGPGSALAGLQPLGPLQMPMMASMGGSCAAQAGGMAGMGSMGGGNGGDAMLMLPKSDPDELMQLEMKGGLAMGIGQDPAPEAMDDLLNFFFKG